MLIKTAQRDVVGKAKKIYLSIPYNDDYTLLSCLIEIEGITIMSS